MTMVTEHNIKNSFRTVKGDIMQIQGELFGIKEQQARVLMMLDEINSKLKNLQKTKKK